MFPREQGQNTGTVFLWMTPLKKCQVAYFPLKVAVELGSPVVALI